MRLLHISNGYCGSKVHSELYRRLDLLGIDQIIYAYYREKGQEGKNQFKAERTVFLYRPILSLKHRILYHQKLKKVYYDIIKQIGNEPLDLSHATSLFSDGAIAYKLWKNRGIPYVVTVRNTDINEFLQIAPWAWSMGIEVLRHAKKIVFISKAPMEKFCRHFVIRRILNEITPKIVLQPNGIDDYWLDHKRELKENINHDIIYVGKFDVNKNVARLIQAVLQLRKIYPDLHLHLVGGDGWNEKKILKMVERNQSCLTYHGKIYDKDKLRDLYGRCSIFAMPSIHETFGLVYIEALTQKLSVLYTKRQGIDGLFDKSVGEAVNAWSINSIKNGLSTLLQYPYKYKGYNEINYNQFRWNAIAQKYVQLYNDCI